MMKCQFARDDHICFALQNSHEGLTLRARNLVHVSDIDITPALVVRSYTLCLHFLAASAAQGSAKLRDNLTSLDLSAVHLKK